MRRLNTYKDCADRTWFGKPFQQLVRRHANEKDLALFVQCVLNTLKLATSYRLVTVSYEETAIVNFWATYCLLVFRLQLYRRLTLTPLVDFNFVETILSSFYNLPRYQLYLGLPC